MVKRRTLDSRGKPVVEAKNADGVFVPVPEVDSDILRNLKAEELRLLDTRKQPLVGKNPYQGATVPESKKLRKRSGLDYLRKLSEEIMRQRAGAGDGNGDEGGGDA
jgi:hypothetical protein